MYLPLLLTRYLMVLVLGIVQAADGNRLAYQEISGGQKVIRRSRSVLDIANPAIKALIKSAVEVPTSSQMYRKFLKQGQVSDAIADFNKLEPTHVRRIGFFAKEGFVGDTELKLKIQDRINSWLPTILIADPKSAKLVKIIYVNCKATGKGPVKIP